MGEMIKRLSLILLFLIGGMGVSLLSVREAGAEERKPKEVKMPLKPLPEDALITMDFQDVDLSVVIKFIGELTGKNFLVSDQVRGKVTIISPKKITVREAYKVFESVLEMNGFTAVPGADAIKIIPSGIARQAGLEIHEGKEPSAVKVEDRMITQVVPLEHAVSDEVRALFTPLISKDGTIVSYKPTNHLIITERASNIHRLLKIIEQIDVRIVEEKISVFSLEFASAKSLAEKITQLISIDPRPPTPARPPGPPATQRVFKVIPDERTNNLIVLANHQDTQDIRRLISSLDKEAPKGKSQLHVRYLEHARAEELAKVLSSIVGSKAKAAPRTTPPAAPAAEETSITADKATNSLVITTSPQEFAELEEVIQKLDTVRSQVLVEALIAEVSMEKALQIGMDWRLMDQPVEGSVRGFGGTDFGLISGIQTGTLRDPGLVLGVSRGFITIGGQQFINLGAIIRAFQKDTDVNVLSTPHLLTMDNQKAKIIVADNVPILKTDLTTPLAAATATATNIAVSRTFEYKDIGIQLEITPQISKASMVRLEISMEVSNITSVDAANPGFVTTRKRQANTTVVVESGQMMVIGGLIRDDRSEETKKVPCLGNVPVFGWLFKTYGGSKSKTNLLVFITPHIIRSAEDMEKATARKKQEADENLKKLQKEREKEVKDTYEMLIK
ncbi:MAG: type II secretion system protein GspD [Deltaproteobacteria bacterium]|nr:type II secretion system protein GspD [Deltaproteobacteria bacterium]